MYKICLNVVCTWSLSKPNDDTRGIVTTVDCRVRSGDEQSFQFDIAANKPPPPFNKLNAPYYNTEVGVNPKTKKPIIQLGYAGVGKGIFQVLWERGLWMNGMQKKLPNDHPDFPELDASKILGNCADFRTEKTAMVKLIHSYGHLVEFAPKGHPECAECGIEYDNGLAKRHFRQNNLQIATNCERDAINAYHQITLATSYRTSCVARSYMKAYLDGSGKSHFSIEKFVKHVRCHRSIFDMAQKTLGVWKKNKLLINYMKH